MLRFLELIFHNPLAIFKIIYYWIQIIIDKLKSKKTIVLNLHYDYFFDIFSTIYDQLKNRKNTKVYFSYLHNNLSLKKYLMNNCDKQQLISNKISPFIPFDIFICAEVTGPDFPIKLFKTKKIQIYHGMGTYNLLSKKNVLNKFEIHFAMGIRHNKFIEQLYKNNKSYRIYDVGYPKTDKIFIKPDDTIKLKYTEKNKKTVLYAPHWHEFGSIHKYGEKLIKSLAKLPITILVKPHNYLYEKYPNANWKNRILNLCDGYHNVKFVTEADTQIVYPISDMIITDPGTTASLEFSLLRRPYAIFCNENWFHNKHDIIIEKALFDASFCFRTTTELAKIVEKYVNDDTEYMDSLTMQKKSQESIINKYLYNPGKATPKAIEAIEKELAKC